MKSNKIFWREKTVLTITCSSWEWVGSSFTACSTASCNSFRCVFSILSVSVAWYFSKEASSEIQSQYTPSCSFLYLPCRSWSSFCSKVSNCLLCDTSWRSMKSFNSSIFLWIASVEDSRAPCKAVSSPDILEVNASISHCLRVSSCCI